MQRWFAREIATSPVLQRLAQRVKRLRLEFGQSVEEGHAQLWASEISPGRAPEPPPTRAGIEAGVMRRANRPPVLSSPPARAPATEWIIETSSSSRGVKEAKSRAGAAAPANMLPGPGGTMKGRVLAPGRSNFERAFGALLALDFEEMPSGIPPAARMASASREMTCDPLK